MICNTLKDVQQNSAHLCSFRLIKKLSFKFWRIFKASVDLTAGCLTSVKISNL
jgi:hypothetical protein